MPSRRAQIAGIELGLKRTNHGRPSDPITPDQKQTLIAKLRGDIGDFESFLSRQESWSSLHQSLAKSAVQLKKRGAGLIFEDNNGVKVRASEVSRLFGIGQLTKRFGAFEGEDQTPIPRRHPAFDLSPSTHDAAYHRLWNGYYADRKFARRDYQRAQKRLGSYRATMQTASTAGTLGLSRSMKSPSKSLARFW
jgi:hypothetical protein